jgi:hypothetical protein
MRQLQNQARDLARQEEDIARNLASLNSADHQTLDNTEQRQQLVQQMARQQAALTNLLDAMQNVTEKAESTEPLLSEQLYDALRRAGQMHTESLLQAGGELVNRGFLAKATEVEQAARTNINELSQKVEHAAESVLGSQSEALRYAQSELNDLAKQVERGLGDAATNTAGPSGTGTNLAASSGAGTNAAESSGSRANASSGSGAGTNSSAAGEQANAAGDGQRANPSSASGAGSNSSPAGEQANAAGDGQRLSDLVRQIGNNAASNAGGEAGGANAGDPIFGGGFANWADRMRDVEQVVDSVELRGRLATIRERVAAFRAEYRSRGRRPPAEIVRFQVVQPMTDVRAQLQEDLARLENARSLVPLDHDPVPDNYSELVRKYYEKLGGGQ